MLALEGVLTDEEIIAVPSWIKAQWPADIRARHGKFHEQASRRLEAGHVDARFPGTRAR